MDLTYICPQCDCGCNVCDNTGSVRTSPIIAAALDLTYYPKACKRSPELADGVEWMGEKLRRNYRRAVELADEAAEESAAWVAGTIDPILARYVEGSR